LALRVVGMRKRLLWRRMITVRPCHPTVLATLSARSPRSAFLPSALEVRSPHRKKTLVLPSSWAKFCSDKRGDESDRRKPLGFILPDSASGFALANPERQEDLGIASAGIDFESYKFMSLKRGGDMSRSAVRGLLCSLLVCLFILAGLHVPAAWGQGSSTGTISITVLDPSGR